MGVSMPVESFKAVAFSGAEEIDSDVVDLASLFSLKESFCSLSSEMEGKFVALGKQFVAVDVLVEFCTGSTERLRRFCD